MLTITVHALHCLFNIRSIAIEPHNPAPVLFSVHDLREGGRHLYKLKASVTYIPKLNYAQCHLRATSCLHCHCIDSCTECMAISHVAEVGAMY